MQMLNEVQWMLDMEDRKAAEVQKQGPFLQKRKVTQPTSSLLSKRPKESISSQESTNSKESSNSKEGTSNVSIM